MSDDTIKLIGAVIGVLASVVGLGVGALTLIRTIRENRARVSAKLPAVQLHLPLYFWQGIESPGG